MNNPLSRNVWDTVSNPGMKLSAGTLSAIRTDVTFSNSNGVSFGLETNGVITASAVGGGGGSVNISAGTTSTNANSYTFSNANNISFGLGTGANAGVITASVAPSAAGVTISDANTSLTVGRLAFTNSNGLTLGLSTAAGSATVTGSYTVPTVTNSSWTVSDTATSATVGQLAFSNSNNVTFGLSTSNNGNHTITASVPNVTNSSWTVSDTVTSATVGRLAFTAANGITMTLSTSNNGNHTVFASYTVPSTAGHISAINLSAGTTSTNASAFTFSNSNGLAFGLNGATLTASYTVPSVTNSSWTVSDSATSATVGRLAFTASNGLTLTLSTSNNGNHTVIGSYTVPTVTSWTVSDSATSATVGRLAFTASNGLTLTLSTSNNGNHTVIGSYTVPSTAGLISAINLSAGTTSTNKTNFTFSNANGISFGLDTGGNAGIVTASYTVPSVTNSSWTVSDSATSATVGRLAFTASNGITMTLSTSNNGNHTLIASYTVPTVTNSQWTVSDSATSATVGRLAFTASNGLTLTLSTSNNGNHTVIGSYTVPTVTSWTVSDSATSATVGRLAFTNGNGVSFALSTSNNGNQTVSASIATTYAGTGFTTATTTGTNLVGTQNTSGLSLGVPVGVQFFSAGNYSSTNSSNVTAGSYYLAGGANVTIQQSNNTISISAAAAAAAPVQFSAGTTSQNLGTIKFADSNGVSFGLGTGANSSVLTASAAGGGVALSNSQTLFSTGTVNLLEGGGAITIASSAGGQSLKFSVPQTSSLVGVSGISISTNGSTITVYATPVCGYLEPYPMTNTALLGPTAGSWYLAPFVAPEVLSGGRINLLHQNTSTAALFRDITGASYHSNSTGTLQQSYTYSKVVALWSQGSGTNSTRLESIWSNSFSFGWSKDVRVSLSQASNINISVSHSISYISEIGSDGAYTLNQFASNRATSVANSSTASNWGDSIFASGRNMVSNSIIEPIGFNTTILPGAYWLGFAWSTTRATASTGGNLASALDFAVSSELGISRLILESAYRNWGSTATTARSHIMPYGVYTGAANMAPPQYINFSSDLSSLGSAWVPYFNFQNQGITK